MAASGSRRFARIPTTSRTVSGTSDAPTARDCKYRLGACHCNHWGFDLRNRVSRLDCRQSRLLKSRRIGNRYAADYDSGCAPQDCVDAVHQRGDISPAVNHDHRIAVVPPLEGAKSTG
jgi:hypothetical protein